MSVAVETPTPAPVAPPTPAPAAPAVETPAATPAAVDPRAKPAPRPGTIDALEERKDTWDPKAWAAERKAEREREASTARGKPPADDKPKTETPPSAKSETAPAVAADAAAASAPPREIKVKLRGEEKAIAVDKIAGALRIPVAAVEAIAKEHGDEPLANAYQKLWNADQQASEKAEIERERNALDRKMRTIMGKAKASPLEVARMIFEHADATLSVKEVALQIAQEELELEQLPEAEQKYKRLEAQLERERNDRQELLAENERLTTEREAEAKRIADEKFVVDFNNEVTGALTDAKLPVQGYVRTRLLTLLANEKASLGERYVPPATAADMRGRIVRHIAQVEKEVDEAVKARAEALGVEKFAEIHAPIAEQIGARAAEARVDQLRRNQRAQTQAKAEPAEERARPPIRRDESITDWIDRVF